MKRKECLFERQQHKLINNWINCGRIVSLQEGDESCLFFVNSIMKKGDVLIDDSNFPYMELKTLYSKAVFHKENYQIYTKEIFINQILLMIKQIIIRQEKMFSKYNNFVYALQCSFNWRRKVMQNRQMNLDEAKQILKNAEIEQKKKNGKTTHLVENKNYQYLYNEIITNLNEGSKKESKKIEQKIKQE
ncbi:unnamed protein product [Paramecium sonneborni]|uniref:Uncharacterized protein n=1 Tax=Paramecium sonneborni TaxID=65129 RepID=A0A8S1R1K9_9CILI|nr:unnamed protein product [Paramecium sonneborni]